jgi:hypothetical protein
LLPLLKAVNPTKNRLLEFKTIFQEIFNIEPFVNAKECNIDVVNALNYAIFCELQGRRVAQEGLRVVLRRRKDRFNWEHPMSFFSLP